LIKGKGLLEESKGRKGETEHRGNEETLPLSLSPFLLSVMLNIPKIPSAGNYLHYLCPWLIINVNEEEY